MKISTVILLLFVCSAAMFSQTKQKGVSVSDTEVISQLNAVIYTDEQLGHNPPAHTLELVKKVLALNEMQRNLAMLRAAGQDISSFAAKFYDKRRQVCREYSGKIVDLDGQLKLCKCETGDCGPSVIAKPASAPK